MSFHKLQALVVAASLLSLSAAAAQRTFVASFGNDANTAANCSFVNPCRSFAGAQTVVDDGGEIIALDAAGYGAITITKSVSLVTNSGFYAGISVGTGTGVTIATAGRKVILRGLNVNGTGGTHGLVMTDGASLTIENCVFSNFPSGNAIHVNTPASVRIANTIVRDNQDGIRISGGASADISNVKAYGNTSTGIMAEATVVTTTNVAVSDSIVAGNTAGFFAATSSMGGVARLSITRSSSTNNQYGAYVGTVGGLGSAVMVLFGNMITHNSSIGVYNVGATVESFGHNVVRLNGTDTSGAITTVAPL